MRPRLSALAIVILGLVLAGCVKRLDRALVTPATMRTLDGKSAHLKVHMRDGTMYLLDPWRADEALRVVTGTGVHFDLARTATGTGAFTIPIDSVAIFETNVVRPSPSVAALAVVTGITAGVALLCAANPKACFGSCPTFYVTDGTHERLQAEGFSASVAPRLEATDVDALFRARAHGREVRVRMRNEAYETHVIRHVDLLAVPRPPDGRVVADQAGGFWEASAPLPPTRCDAEEGDCRAALATFDEQERWSLADSTDLATRETIDLAFPAVAGSPALLLASRQSLLPTYLLYQTFAYLGTTTGSWLAAFERADPTAARRANALSGAIGGIDVLVPDGHGGWDSVATIRETGPLAADVRAIPLPIQSGETRVRLRMARGAWRIDQAALTSLRGRVTPLRLTPHRVRSGPGGDSAARTKLVTRSAPLITYPGDDYTLDYRLPGDAGRYELFLETRGYYLEWMRSEWLAEEDRRMAAGMFLDPAGSLRRLAPAFKAAEASLEASFWGSKYEAR